MDIFDSLSPLLWLCRLFGLLPFPVEILFKGKFIPFGVGRALCSYRVFLYVVTTITTVVATVYHFQHLKEIKRTMMHQYLTSFWIICEELIGMLCSNLYLYRSAKLRTLLVRLAHFDLESGYLKHLKETKYKVKLQMICLALFIPLFFYLFSRIKHRSILLKSLGTFWIVVILILQSLALNIFYCVMSRRRVLNCALRELLLDRSSLVSHGRHYKFMSMSVATIGRLDQELSSATKDANEVFGEALLIIVAFNVVDLTFMIFFGSDLLSYPSVWDYIFVITRIFLYLVGTILIATTGEQLSREMRLTGVLVSEVILKARDLNSRRQLNLFSKQLQHTRVFFTARGFFTMNLSMLKSMAAAVASYVVILVQFQEMDQGLNPKCSCHKV